MLNLQMSKLCTFHLIPWDKPISLSMFFVLCADAKFAAANSTLAKQRMPLQAVQRADVQMSGSSFHPTLIPRAVPEHTALVVDYTKEDDALAAYMARTNLLHHGISVKTSAVASSVPGGTRMRY